MLAFYYPAPGIFAKGPHPNGHPEVEFQPEEHQGQPLEPSALRSSDFRTVLGALQMVEESHRSTLELFYLGDLPYKEISAALGLPIGTVMSRLSRGKEQLRSALTTALEGDPSKDGSISKNSGFGGLR